MHEVRDRIEKLASRLEEQAEEAERLGRLPDETARLMRESGIVRLAQPREWSGYQAHPVELLEAIMAVASRCGSTGWVMGVVSVHPWEMALLDRKLQAEVWGEDPDVWLASPYTPLGRAVARDDGFVLNGRWAFSSGTDHCRWAILGGVVTGLGKPKLHHFVLPRSDYEIVEDSWNAVGLVGTGSKDVIVRDAFVPRYRMIDIDKLGNGLWVKERGIKEPLYNLPFNVVFGAAIASAVIGIAEGVLASFVGFQRKRVNVFGGKEAESVHGMVSLGEASADIAASRAHVLHDISRLYDLLERGGEITPAHRAECRRSQVRAARRAVNAADELFARSGGGALRLDRPIQRMWRDAHAALAHVMNVPGLVYQAYSATVLGTPMPAAAVLI